LSSPFRRRYGIQNGRRLFFCEWEQAGTARTVLRAETSAAAIATAAVAAAATTAVRAVAPARSVSLSQSDRAGLFVSLIVSSVSRFVFSFVLLWGGFVF